MSSGFSIPGLDSFQSALSSIDPRDHAQQNVTQAAEMLREDIASRAPRDTGHLAQSYQVDVTGGGSHVSARVYTDVEYARFQEFGTVHQAGTAHVRPAFDANRERLLDMMGAQTISATFDQIR